MLSKSSKPSETDDPRGDPLSEMLRGLRLDGVEYGRFQMKAPWGLRFPAQDAARFHFVAGRGCWLQTPAQEWVRVAPGDAVLLPRGSTHVLASDRDVEPILFCKCSFQQVCEKVFETSGGGDGEQTLLFSGSMT